LSAYLLDTNVVSELAKNAPDAKVLAWLSSLGAIAVSVVTLDELAFGIERAPPKKKGKLQVWFAELLDAQPTILDVTPTVALAAGRMRALREAKGRSVAQADMLIGASAQLAGLVLATRNTRDFEGCGIALINPFA
jgi:toxin FitB